jgi:endonuclease/exonuclease/phosphatase family metal-dependent hydrolase
VQQKKETAKEESNNRWNEQLASLQEMGFTNLTLLVQLLTKFNGNMSAVVQELMIPRNAYTPLSIKFGTDKKIRVMSYNIRFDNPDDKQDTWQYRRQALVDKVVLKYRPDILGLQEALIHQYRFIQNNLKNSYYSVSIGREYDPVKKEHFGEHASIFYNTEKFSLLKSGTFWLSETPEKDGSKGWDAACTRICTWALLQSTSGAQDVCLVANTHWDHVGVQARLNSAELMKRMLHQIAITSDPKPCAVIIMGDFNCEMSSQELQQLQASDTFKLLNTREALLSKPECILGPEATFTGFDGSQSIRIDHIFVTEKLSVVQYHCIEEFTDNQRRPSDHRAIMTTLSL